MTTALKHETRADADAGQTRTRVVVAEDSYVIREFLTATLSAAPEIELMAVCTNGKELRTAVATWDPEVVLTDIRMPPSGAAEGVRVAPAFRENPPDLGLVLLGRAA